MLPWRQSQGGQPGIVSRIAYHRNYQAIFHNGRVRSSELRSNILQACAGCRPVGQRECLRVCRSGAGEDLAPFLVPEEECLLTICVVYLRDEERSTDIAAEDVVVSIGQR